MPNSFLFLLSFIFFCNYLRERVEAEQEGAEVVGVDGKELRGDDCEDGGY